MDTETALKSAIKKGLEELIKAKYISKQDIVALDACVSVIEREIRHFDKERIKNEKLSEMFTIMNEYMPQLFQKLVNEG